VKEGREGREGGREGGSTYDAAEGELEVVLVVENVHEVGIEGVHVLVEQGGREGGREREKVSALNESDKLTVVYPSPRYFKNISLFSLLANVQSLPLALPPSLPPSLPPPPSIKSSQQQDKTRRTSTRGKSARICRRRSE
jgi:hypothetical protein